MPFPPANAAAVALAIVLFAAAPAPAADDAADDASVVALYTAAVEQTLTGNEETDLALASIREVPASSLPAFDKWFGANAHRMPPIYLFTYASRVFSVDPQQSARWFFFARTRLFYDALRCRDETVLERIVEYDAARGEIVAYIQANPAAGAAAASWALKWEITHDPATQPQALLEFCLTGKEGWQLAKEQGKLAAGVTRSTGDDQSSRVLVALPDVDDAAKWVVPAAAYPQARSDAIAITQRVIDQLTAAPKSGG